MDLTNVSLPDFGYYFVCTPLPSPVGPTSSVEPGYTDKWIKDFIYIADNFVCCSLKIGRH